MADHAKQTATKAADSAEEKSAAAHASTDAKTAKETRSAPAHKRAQSQGFLRVGTRPLAIGAGIVACMLIAAFGIGFVAWQTFALNSAAEAQKAAAPDPAQFSDAEAGNPIDFAALQADNPDIYAWICIPDTNVNLPVAQSPDDDGFYLSHNAQGEYSPEGAVYSERVNTKDFSDPITVLYGHNTPNGIMFGDLHKFEDPTFFNDNSQIYISVPGRVLTYEVLAAYPFDNRHLMHSYDFEHPDMIQTFYDEVLTARDGGNLREDATLAAGDDHLLILSTCVNNGDRLTERFLVATKLVGERATA